MAISIVKPNPPLSSSAAFVAIDSNGDIVDVSESRQRAIESLERLGPGYIAYDDDDDGGNRPVTRNPAGDNPIRALERAGLAQLDFDRVERMPLEHAHKELLPYFHLLKKGGESVKAYKTPEGMAHRFLGQNYKTAKTTPEDPSLVMGLTLLPADRLTVKYLDDLDKSRDSRVNALVRTLLRSDDRLVSIARPHRSLSTEKRRAQWTMCAGSTDECRNSCLVYTGRNVADVYNNRRKAVGTIALVERPEAFCRMLIEAIRSHTRSESCQGMKPFVRLNVLSDVPWELLIPGLFDYFSPRNYGGQTIPGFGAVTAPMFYDYTKVANRKPPSNYDLTFSYSGRNELLARSELARGIRVAVVFLAFRPKGRRDQWETFRFVGKAPPGGHKPQVDLPDTFWGHPVIDGDISDIRPRDPRRCIVGLRWKTPAGQRVDPTDESFRFVTRAFHVGDEIFPEEEYAQAQALREYLVSPVTARYQPVDQDADED